MDATLSGCPLWIIISPREKTFEPYSIPRWSRRRPVEWRQWIWAFFGNWKWIWNMWRESLEQRILTKDEQHEEVDWPSSRLSIWNNWKWWAGRRRPGACAWFGVIHGKWEVVISAHDTNSQVILSQHYPHTRIVWNTLNQNHKTLAFKSEIATWKENVEPPRFLRFC